MAPKTDAQRQMQRTRAITCLLSNPTVTSAASAAGVSDRTLQRWMAEPGFQSELHAASQALLEQAARRLVGLSACAIGVLGDVMSDAVTPAGVRARSADLILGNALKLQEQVTLQARVRKLEDTTRGSSPCPNN